MKLLIIQFLGFWTLVIFLGQNTHNFLEAKSESIFMYNRERGEPAVVGPV
jgi:hypothetical protein